MLGSALPAQAAKPGPAPSAGAAPAQVPAAPPPVAVAEKDGFGVIQLSTTDADRFNAEWRQSTGDVSVTTNNATVRNRPIHTFILFKGCLAAEDGNCHVTAEYWVYDPSGKLYGYTKGMPLWRATKPTGRAYAMGELKMSLRVENGERLGVYTVRFRTTDDIAAVTVETEANIAVSEAR